MRFYEMERKRSEVGYPFRISFDCARGIPHLLQMHQNSQAGYSLTKPPHHRAVFYFADLSQLTAFIAEFGPGRPIPIGADGSPVLLGDPEYDFPLRIIFDVPMGPGFQPCTEFPGVAEMAASTDAHAPLSLPPFDRMAFYFATFERLQSFVDQFGPGRTMGPKEGKQVRRNMGTFAHSITLPE